MNKLFFHSRTWYYYEYLFGSFQTFAPIGSNTPYQDVNTWYVFTQCATCLERILPNVQYELSTSRPVSLLPLLPTYLPVCLRYVYHVPAIHYCVKSRSFQHDTSTIIYFRIMYCLSIPSCVMSLLICILSGRRIPLRPCTSVYVFSNSPRRSISIFRSSKYAHTDA